MYKYIVLTVFIFGISCAPQPPKIDETEKECSENYAVENCIQPLLVIGNKENHFPNTTAQIIEFCGMMKEVETCLKDFTNRCVSFTRRKSTDYIISGVIRLGEKRCKSQNEQKEFIKNSKCGNAAIGDLKSCLDDYRTTLRESKIVERLPVFCCKYYKFRECVKKSFTKVGSELCPKDSQKYYAGMFEAFQSEVFNSMCSDYRQESDKCKSMAGLEVGLSSNIGFIFAPVRDAFKTFRLTFK